MNMNDLSVLIGGKAGEGINQAGLIIAQVLSQLGYRIYIYYDYPSLIRGGHNFSIIRASKDKIATHKNKIDFLLALNQDTVDFHKARLKDKTIIIYDSDTVESLPDSRQGMALSLRSILKQEEAPELMRNSCIIGAFCKIAGIPYDILKRVFHKTISKEVELNLKVAQRGYEKADGVIKVEELSQHGLPIFTGNEAIGLGLIKGGLKTYIAYPMTPSSGLLHFLAAQESINESTARNQSGESFIGGVWLLAQRSEENSLKVIHPENEIAVILMALGFSYAGEKVAVGTSGGGFCLMTEGLSLASMAELPVVIVVAQRPGPSTGVPTYTAQGDLHFVLNAGQGEFMRLVVSPGDAEEAYYWSGVVLQICWRYQIPSVILTDKALSEGTYSLDFDSIEELKETKPILWDRSKPYKRYSDTERGVSPLCSVPEKDAIIKVNSYEHDEYGITTEDPQKITLMQNKRSRKESYLIKELERYRMVKVYGNNKASSALICWGSNKGVCVEIAEKLGLKVIQPVVLSPFPVQQLKDAFDGVKRLICVENNATAQLARLLSRYGLNVDEKILKYDGRPFSLDELEERLKGSLSAKVME